MFATTLDDVAIRRHARRGQLIALPALILFIAIFFHGSAWLTTHAGLRPEVAHAAAFMVILLLSSLAQRLTHFGGTLTPRQHALLIARQNRRLDRFRPILIIYLAVNIVTTIGMLRHLRAGVAIDHPINLAIVMSVSLLPWRLNLFIPRWAEPTDELVRMELLQAAVRGFATLIVLSLIAIVGNDARPGTLHVTLALALLVSALVAHLSLWAQDLQARRGADDR